MEQYRFQVNLGGMIELLSDHLYSSPDVYIRELLQNGVDAITAREKTDQSYHDTQDGELYLTLKEGHALFFHDNGVGLTKEEIHKFLAIIGESSKRDLVDLVTGKIQSEYIGRFGIGLLSCFMVADEICIRTRSIHGTESFEWIGKPDGTYTLTRLENELQPGTEIYLTAKDGFEEYFTREKIEELLLYYGLILPYPILLDDGKTVDRINPAVLPWKGKETSKKNLLFFGHLMFHQQFMDCIVLHTEEGGIDGVAYILPYSVQPSTRQKHRIYLKNMLLTEDGDGILPDWAVFTKCIINAKELRPTASRESFYKDDMLDKAREALGRCISDHLKQMAVNDKDAFAKFLSVHSLAVKSIAIDNDELYQLFIDDLEFSTTKGTITGHELRLSKEVLLYCGMEKYRQLSQIFVAQGRLLINVGYVYDHELLLKMPSFYDVRVSQVDETKVDDMLQDVTLQDAEDTVDFLEKAGKVLAEFSCNVEIKQFTPENLPAFYYQNESAKMYNTLKRAQENSGELFSDMLSGFSTEYKKKAEATLFFNLRNPVVKKMAALRSDTKIEDIITIIYIQTLLIGGFPLRNNELGIMNDKLLSIIGSLL